uniref:Putative phosphatidate phosphatase n=1 Tax=Lygus hesperus TaxID=30085 RepID=A0A0A9Y9K8_LYGHE
MDSRSVLKKVITDFVVLSAVALPLLVFRLFGTPPVRGFFCNDETIRYPFKDSTVPNIALYFVGLGLPIIVAIIPFGPFLIFCVHNGLPSFLHPITYPLEWISDIETRCSAVLRPHQLGYRPVKD